MDSSIYRRRRPRPQRCCWCQVEVQWTAKVTQATRDPFAISSTATFLRRSSSPDGSSDLDRARHYVRHCLNLDIRQGVTPQNILDDVELVYRQMVRESRLEGTPVLVLAHSEGTLNVARLVAQGRIEPDGVLALCGLTESPVGILKWQVIDRYVEAVMAWDRNADGRVTSEEVRTGYSEDGIFSGVGILVDELLPSGNGWTESSLRAFFTSRYLEMKSEALATDDAVSYPRPSLELEFVIASNAWWKQWFTDEVGTLDLFRNYHGRLAYHLGEIDSQCPGGRQLEFARSRLGGFHQEPSFVLHPNRGHNLRSGDSLMGPMDESALESLVHDLVGMAATPVHPRA